MNEKEEEMPDDPRAKAEEEAMEEAALEEAAARKAKRRRKPTPEEELGDEQAPEEEPEPAPEEEPMPMRKAGTVEPSESEWMNEEEIADTVAAIVNQVVPGIVKSVVEQTVVPLVKALGVELDEHREIIKAGLREDRMKRLIRKAMDLDEKDELGDSGAPAKPGRQVIQKGAEIEEPEPVEEVVSKERVALIQKAQSLANHRLPSYTRWVSNGYPDSGVEAVKAEIEAVERAVSEA